MLGLQGKTAIITGASRGIGLAIARAFAAHGASKLFIVGRDGPTLDKATTAINACGKAQISSCVGSVSDREMWKQLVKNAGNVDILVNAAGVTHASLLVATSASSIEKVYETNLLGTTWGCQSVAKAMIRAKRSPENPGCIINIASLLGLKGGRGSAAYAASKAGVIGLTRPLADELGRSNIRVNVIVPGYIDTMMTDAMPSEAVSQALKSIPQKRFGTVDEVAHAAVFLATNTYANNTVLNLDGGLSAT